MAVSVCGGEGDRSRHEMICVHRNLSFQVFEILPCNVSLSRLPDCQPVDGAKVIVIGGDVRETETTHQREGEAVIC